MPPAHTHPDDAMPDDKRPRGREAQTAGRRDIADLLGRGGPFVEAVEATHMPMVVTDAQRPGSPVLYANPAFLRMLGRGPD